MVNCCVPFCPSKKGQTKNISFHEFPSDDTLRQLWLQMISREGETPGTQWIPTQRSTVCSRHFLTTNYSTKSSRKVLLPGAHPTIFEDFPEHSQRKVHFEPSQFERAIPGKLKPNAIPTIFSYFRQSRVGKRTSLKRGISKKCPRPPRKKILLDHLNVDESGDTDLGRASPDEDYEDDGLVVLKNYAVPSKLEIPPLNRDLKVVINAEERDICMRGYTRNPEKYCENSKESSIDNRQELRAENIHMSMPSVEDFSYSADVKTRDLSNDLKYHIECIVVNPPVDPKETREFETLDDIYILRKMLDDGDMLLKSDHMKQMEKVNRRCAILENELAKSRKQLEDLKKEDKNVNNQCEHCAALKECVKKEKLKIQEVTKKLTEKIKTMENDIKFSPQLSKTSPTIVRASPEYLLKRVFTENQVNLLLLKKNKIPWTKEEMNYFLRLSHQISKRAYVFLVCDMKLPFPGTQELEAFSEAFYPDQPVFYRTNENEAPATDAVKCVVPSSSVSATISTRPIPLNGITDLVSPMSTNGKVTMKSVVPSKNVNATLPVHSGLVSPMSTTGDIAMVDVHTDPENNIPTECDNVVVEDQLFYLITASEILN